jgi:poly(3-hydroxybutyrate) depolymerase/CubicO group peptidase (beta-lactamase class C family)
MTPPPGGNLPIIGVMRDLIIACLSLSLATGALADLRASDQAGKGQQSAPQQSGGQRRGTDLAGVRAAADAVNRSLGLKGSGLTVVRPHNELHRSLHGSFSGEQVLPISSASKWLAVATIMTLVDEGKLDLDLPVSRYVKEFERDDHRRVTLRQCLSCISALPGAMTDRMKGWDMNRFASEAADESMRNYPGTAFIYGDVSFQVVAIAAERVSGMSWHKLFAQRIAEPLGLRDTKFGAGMPIGSDAGTTKLPWVAGGAVSTLNDYSRFVRMLLAKGQWHGKAVMSQESVHEMLRNQVPTRIDVKTDFLDTKHLRYGLGTWIENLRDETVRLSDPGALGFTPWIDPDLEIGGVFAVKDRGQRVRRKLSRVYKAVREAVTSPAVAGTSETVRVPYGGRNRRYHLHVPAHEQNHAGLPLLVVLHGGGGSGEQAREATRLDRFGVQAGFIVAFPDGTGLLPKKQLAWNSGDVGVYASRHEVDDVGFLKKVVLDIQKKVPVNSDRIYVVGHSNGGMMCHRLAREAADVFDGIAVVAGAMNFTSADADVPVATLLIHGSDDKHVRIEGGETVAGRDKRVDASLQDAVDYYIARNNLVGYPVTSEKGGAHFQRYVRGKTSDAALLWVVKLDGGGHAWPGADRRTSSAGDIPHSWHASRWVVSFFAGLSLGTMGRDFSPAVPR